MTTTELIRTGEPVLSFTQRVLEAAGRATPDFEDVPLYAIVLRMSNARGMACPGLCKTFETELRASGRFDGYGPTIALDSARRYLDSYIAAADVPGMTHRQADKRARLSIAGLASHELGHVIDTGDTGDDEPVGGNAELSKRGFIRCVNNPTPNVWQPENQAPWEKHGPRFVRAVAHLTWRFRPFLPELRFDDVFLAKNYALSPLADYATSLAVAGELKSKAPIAGLIATKPPAEFVNLWRHDIGRWYTAIEDPTGEQTKMAEQGLALCPR